jgi:hypothetical protein
MMIVRRWRQRWSGGGGGGGSGGVAAAAAVKVGALGDYEANQVPVKNGTCFTYFVCRYVCLPSKHGMCSGFSKCQKPSSDRKSGGIGPECAT